MNEPKKILHVVGAMNRGGVETWLMHVLRNIDRDRYQFDFLVSTTEKAAYDDEIRELGGRIIPIRSPSFGLGYAREFIRVVKQLGPYDVVHSHVHHYSGVTLTLARYLSIPIRIAHSHSDTSELDTGASLGRRIYLRSTELAIRMVATHKLAASGFAAASLFGADWESDPRCQVLYCGIDLQPFMGKREPDLDVRKKHGIPEETRVVGHVGSFSYPKNHRLIVDIASDLLRRSSHICFLLVGDGALRPEIEALVRERGLNHMFVFAGVQSEIPRLMMKAMDLFILPSHYEGLPLVGMEAQAAGLPSLISDRVTSEVTVIPELVTLLPITEVGDWVNQILSEPVDLDFRVVNQSMWKSEFNILNGISSLRKVYAG